MQPTEQLWAYIATLGALTLIMLASLIVAAIVPDVLAQVGAFGLGTVTGGLIGALRAPSARTPVAATESGDVNVNGKTDKDN